MKGGPPWHLLTVATEKLLISAKVMACRNIWHVLSMNSCGPAYPPISFCTMGGAISGEKKELSCQVTRNMGKLPHHCNKCHILWQCYKIIVTHNSNMDNNKIVCPHCGKDNFRCSQGLTQHLRNATYCSQAEKEKRDKEDGYYTTPKTITFGDNYWQMHHNKLAKRAKQTDDQRLARHKQFEELAKYISKELSASGTKLGVEEKITTPQQNMGVMTMMAWIFPQAPMLILKRMMQTQKTATMATLRMFCCHQTTQLSPSLKHIAYVPNISCLCKEDMWQPLN
jgi:hypothetical protein